MCCVYSIAQERVSMSLNEAIDIALKSNIEVVIAERQINISEYSVKEAKGHYMPKVTLNGSYSRNIDKQVIFLPEGLGPGGATKIGSDNNFTSYLDLSIPLFSKYNAVNKVYAHSNYNLQYEGLRGTRQTVSANVKKAYFTYLLAMEIVKVRGKALENARENFKNTQTKLLEGVATEFEETTAQVKIATARNNLLEAQSQLIPASNKFKLLLGLPIESEISLTDSIFFNEEELTWFEDPTNLHENSEFRQKEIKVDISKRQTALRRADYFPSLSATGTYQLQSQENNLDFLQYNWVKTSAVGLRLQFPLFNGMVTRNRIKQAMQAERIAEVQKEYTSKHNQSQFNQLQSQLNYAKKRIELYNENISLAEKALGLVKERYHYGKGTFLEVNNAELEYVTARLTYLQAVMDYKSAYYDLELLMGIEN
jgi:outer membrane protein